MARDGVDASGHTGAATTLCAVPLSAPACVTVSTNGAPHADGALRGGSVAHAACDMRRTNAAVWRGPAAVLDLPPGVGECGADMEGSDKAYSTLGVQMMLPLFHVGRGSRMQSDEFSDAAFVAGACQAGLSLTGRLAAL